MVMTLRRHNPPHLGPAIVWYLWLMISTNRFVIFLRDEYEWKGAWEEGCDLFCFHFVLSSNQISVSDRDMSALCLSIQTQRGRGFSAWMDFKLRLSCCTFDLFLKSEWSGSWDWFPHTLKMEFNVISVCHTAAALVATDLTPHVQPALYLSHQLSDHFIGFVVLFLN